MNTLAKMKAYFTKSDKFSWIDAGFLAAGLAVFTTISLWTIAKSSIWFDEAFGAYLIQFDFGEIARYTATDVHPPVYYWLLKIWSMLFGNSEFALRSMSVFFAGIAIVFAYLLVRRLFGKNAARWSLLFVVIAPMLVRYSQEMRMYMLVAAIAFAATYVLTFAVKEHKRWQWATYAVLVSLGMWTHYFSAVVWLSHWIWRAIEVRIQSRQKEFAKQFFTKEWLWAHVVAVGLFLPWLPFLLRQITDVQVNGFWIPRVTPGTVPNFFTNILYYLDQDHVTSWLTLIFVAVVSLLTVLAVKVYKKLSKENKTSYRLILCIAFAPIALLVVLSMPPLQSSFVDRYLIPSSLAISLFIGVTFSLAFMTMRSRIIKIGVVVTVLAMVYGVWNVTVLGNYNKTLHSSNNTRQIIEEVQHASKTTQPIIADSPWLFYEAVFYTTDKNPVYFINEKTEYRYGSLDMLRLNDMHKIKDISAFTKEHPTVWYVGKPNNDTLSAPYENWQPLQKKVVNDSVGGNPAYVAVQFKVN